MMVGLPGSGKTFFAQQFAETFNAPFINAAYVEERGRDEEASSELNAMFLGEIARTNQTFIYEGDSLSRTHRTDFARWARMHNYQPLASPRASSSSGLSPAPSVVAGGGVWAAK